MRSTKAGSRASLLDVPNLRTEDGPSLSLVGDVCGFAQLQGVSAVLNLYITILLGRFCSFGVLGLERGHDGRAV